MSSPAPPGSQPSAESPPSPAPPPRLLPQRAAALAGPLTSDQMMVASRGAMIRAMRPHLVQLVGTLLGGWFLITLLVVIGTAPVTMLLTLPLMLTMGQTTEVVLSVAGIDNGQLIWTLVGWPVAATLLGMAALVPAVSWAGGLNPRAERSEQDLRRRVAGRMALVLLWPAVIGLVLLAGGATFGWSIVLWKGWSGGTVGTFAFLGPCLYWFQLAVRRRVDALGPLDGEGERLLDLKIRAGRDRRAAVRLEARDDRPTSGMTLDRGAVGLRFALMSARVLASPVGVIMACYAAACWWLGEWGDYFNRVSQVNGLNTSASIARGGAFPLVGLALVILAVGITLLVQHWRFTRGVRTADGPAEMRSLGTSAAVIGEAVALVLVGVPAVALFPGAQKAALLVGLPIVLIAYPLSVGSRLTSDLRDVLHGPFGLTRVRQVPWTRVCPPGGRDRSELGASGRARSPRAEGRRAAPAGGLPDLGVRDDEKGPGFQAAPPPTRPGEIPRHL